MAAPSAPLGALGTLPPAAGAAAAAPATAAATAKGEEGPPTFEKPGVVKERLLLATLQEQIKARAAAPEKLRTTGVAFQAVEDVRREDKEIFFSCIVGCRRFVVRYIPWCFIGRLVFVADIL